ncbi:MAG: (2Fe-2S) ferredoxin domain-containing protein [Candidatus Mcinerneyibacterium aminivorans]|uniref:(2Fe-2S) ferredoxin domain-containing protein n=1 Tax=Candidatus Mcinerneyibacterium aminivorans TaxID=2703815 RepID=A0A5D0MHM1_9BACT|nr:MAG: (2Fe-2S) ferredoxin domain-containing protein [Candidatus Mcinerneyibacterium aminivorans]
MMKNLEELRKLREKAQKNIKLRSQDAKIKVVVGMGTSGIAAGAREVLNKFINEINERDLDDVMVTQTGEKGMSSQEPIVEIREENKPTIVYGEMNPDKVEEVVEKHIVNGKVVEEYVVSVEEE